MKKRGLGWQSNGVLFGAAASGWGLQDVRSVAVAVRAFVSGCDAMIPTLSDFVPDAHTLEQLVGFSPQFGASLGFRMGFSHPRVDCHVLFLAAHAYKYVKPCPATRTPTQRSYRLTRR